MLPAIIGLLGLVAVLWAKEPWEAKPYTDWTPEEVIRVLSKSPWVKTFVLVRGSSSGIGTSPQGARSQDITVSTREVGRADNRRTEITSSPPPAAPGSPRGTGTEIELRVVWFSSRTVREAAARKGQLSGGVTEEDAQAFLSRVPEYHTISVTGASLLLLARVPEGDLKQNTYLQPQRSSRKIPPVKVEYLRQETGGLIEVYFHFPKEGDGEPVLPLSEQKVKFSSRYYDVQRKSPESFSVTFDLKRMVRGVKRDL